MKNFIRLILIAVLMPPRAVFATALGSLAASMQPGTWAAVNTNGFNSGALLSQPGSPSDYITQFADKAVWDSSARKFLFMGSAHGNDCYAQFISYDDAANNWAALPFPPGETAGAGPCFTPLHGHSYEDNAGDGAGGFYFRGYNSTQVYKYQVTSGTWAPFPAIPMQSHNCCGALEWFPELGGLIFIDGDWGIWLWNKSGNSWSLLANTNGMIDPSLPTFPMGSYDNFAAYSPAAKAVIFGGGNGSNNVYKLDAAGKVTSMKNAPNALGVTMTLTTMDPASGKLLMLTPSRQIYELDPAQNAWNLTSAAVPFDPTSAIAAPVKDYGVVLFVNYDYGNSAVYLYKHSLTAPPVADIMAPARPGGLVLR